MGCWNVKRGCRTIADDRPFYPWHKACSLSIFHFKVGITCRLKALQCSSFVHFPWTENKCHFGEQCSKGLQVAHGWAIEYHCPRLWYNSGILVMMHLSNEVFCDITVSCSANLTQIKSYQFQRNFNMNHFLLDCSVLHVVFWTGTPSTLQLNTVGNARNKLLYERNFWKCT